MTEQALTAVEAMLVRLALERRQRAEGQALADFEAAVRPVRERVGLRPEERAEFGLSADGTGVVRFTVAEDA